ncbi:sensor histidine kinase [Streptomyces niveus]|uniref:sensor histidine kinase n=1 Tax=Streptomyces niveus TaxID=193462 RepID=UPI003421F3C8
MRARLASVRRRDLAVDVCLVVASMVVGVLFAWQLRGVVDSHMAVDLALGGVSCLALFARRRFPVAVAVVAVVLSAVALGAVGASLAATFSVAIRRQWPTVAWIGALGLVATLVNEWLYPPDIPWAAAALIGSMGTALAVGCGRLVLARRQLVAELTERARRAEADQQERLLAARRQERMSLAHEMHDVLAHRMSLLSVHAGALEFSPGASQEEITRAAGVIRSGAHQMLVDLRAIIGLLREERADDETAPPQPALTELGYLIDESRAAGARVSFSFQVVDAEDAPTMTARTIYRIVQEGLTNARKHAPGQPVAVAVSGQAGRGVSVEIHQPLADGQGAEIPGAGLGIIGLFERVTLAGGRLEHGPRRTGEYELRAWLPWETA